MKIKSILAKFTLTLVCLLPGVSAALSLGELKMTSVPGAPLRGEIEVLSFNPVTPLNEIQVSVPPAAIFKRFGLVKDSLLDRLRFNRVKKGDRLFIKLSASDSIPATATGFLLEVKTNSEKTLKKYWLSSKQQQVSQLKQVVPAPVFQKKLPQHVDFPKTAKAPGKPKVQNHKRKPVVSDLVKSGNDLALQQQPKSAAKQVPNQASQSKKKAVPAAAKEKTGPAIPPQPGNRKTADKKYANGYINYQRAGKSQSSVAEDYNQQSRKPPRYVEQIPFSGQQPVQQAFSQIPENKATYHVESGDTLFKIAAREKFSGITTDQMFLALYQKNAATLDAKKLDQLYIGQRLHLPSKQDVLSVSRTEGRKFKQAYLENHRQAVEQARKAREKREAELKAHNLAQQQKLVAQKQNQTKAKQVQQNADAIKQNKPQSVKVAATTSVSPQKPVSNTNTQVVKPVAIAKMPKAFKPDAKSAGETAESTAARNLALLEDRLRKTKRLLKLEKDKHAITKQTLKKQNRLVQRKDTLLRDLQLAGNKGGVRGSKIQDAGGVITAAPIGQNNSAQSVIQQAGIMSLSAEVEKANRANSAEKAIAADNNWLAPLLGGSVLASTYLNQFIDAFKRPSSWIILLSCLALALLWTVFKLRRKQRRLEKKRAVQQQAQSQPQPAVQTVTQDTPAVANTERVPQTVIINFTEAPKAIVDTNDSSVGHFDDLRQQLTNLRGSLEALSENSKAFSAIRQEQVAENPQKNVIDGNSFKLPDKPPS